MKIGMLLFKAVVWTVTFPLAVLPYRAGLRFGQLGGGLFFRLWASRRRFAVSNVEKAVEIGALRIDGSPEDIARQSFENMGRSMIEAVKMYHGRVGPIMDGVKLEGMDHFQRAEAQGRGIIWITGHCGNWELMSLVMPQLLEIKFGVVARVQNNRYLNQLTEDMRSKSGNRVFYKQGAVKAVLSLLRKKGHVGILIDQAVLVKEGGLVSFLGRPALTTKFPALIARKTGTPLLPAFIHRREDGGHTITIEPPAELSTNPDKDAAVMEDMQTLTHTVEDFIRRYPTQWLWGHRRWKRAPETFPEDWMGKETGGNSKMPEKK